MRWTQDPPTFGAAAILRFVGRASVMNQSLLAMRSLVFVTVSVMVEVDPFVITVGLNALSSCGVTSTICGRSKATSLPEPVAVALYSVSPRFAVVPTGTW